MKKTLASLVFAGILFASCRNRDTPYSQFYEMRYNQTTDSYIASAKFVVATYGSNYIQLANYESIILNGREPDSFSKQENVYFWKGKGEVDGEFILEKWKRQVKNTIKAAEVNNLDFTFPDTISKAKGFTIRIKGLTPEKIGKVSMGLTEPDKWYKGLSVVSDSIRLFPEILGDMGEGEMTLSIGAGGKQDLQTQDGAGIGEMRYLSAGKQKTVWFIK